MAGTPKGKHADYVHALKTLSADPARRRKNLKSLRDLAQEQKGPPHSMRKTFSIHFFV